MPVVRAPMTWGSALVGGVLLGFVWMRLPTVSTTTAPALGEVGPGAHSPPLPLRARLPLEPSPMVDGPVAVEQASARPRQARFLENLARVDAALRDAARRGASPAAQEALLRRRALLLERAAAESIPLDGEAAP